tara:strand:- start:2394 stop:3491 length:1098 start_codon:yes stop_codon:yes gene_type:complete
MKILKWIVKPFFAILIALASAHSFSNQLLPPIRVTHEHECEYLKPEENVDTGKDEDTNKDEDETSVDGEYLDSDTARDRYGISTVSKKSLRAMGFIMSVDLPMILAGEKLLATGDTENVVFTADNTLSISRVSNSSLESVRYSCSDSEVTHAATDSKAFIISTSSEVSILPMDFLVRGGLEFKFTLTCYDDWNEVLIDQSKVRGSSSTFKPAFNEEKTIIQGLFWPIKLDDRHKTLTNQLKLNEDLIDSCHIKEIQQRPMKSEVNIASSTSIEDKDLDSEVTEQQLTENTFLKGWVVKLGLFGNRRNAERLWHKLTKLGWEVHVKYDEKLYGVYVGPAKNQVDAETIQKKLWHQLDMDGLVTYLE